MSQIFSALLPKASGNGPITTTPTDVSILLLYSVVRGRPRLLNSEAISDLQELICKTLTLFLDEIGEWLTTALHGWIFVVYPQLAYEDDHADV